MAYPSNITAVGAEPSTGYPVDKAPVPVAPDPNAPPPQYAARLGAITYDDSPLAAKPYAYAGPAVPPLPASPPPTPAPSQPAPPAPVPTTPAVGSAPPPAPVPVASTPAPTTTATVAPLSANTSTTPPAPQSPSPAISAMPVSQITTGPVVQPAPGNGPPPPAAVAQAQPQVGTDALSGMPQQQQPGQQPLSQQPIYRSAPPAPPLPSQVWQPPVPLVGEAAKIFEPMIQQQMEQQKAAIDQQHWTQESGWQNNRNDIAEERAEAYEQRQQDAALQAQQKDQRDQRNAEANQAESETGQRFFMGPDGIKMPVMDQATGKPLYAPGKLGETTDDSTGRPVIQNRDQYGNVTGRTDYAKWEADDPTAAQDAAQQDIKSPDIGTKIAAAKYLHSKEVDQLQEQLDSAQAQIRSPDAPKPLQPQLRATLEQQAKDLIVPIPAPTEKPGALYGTIPPTQDEIDAANAANAERITSLAKVQQQLQADDDRKALVQQALDTQQKLKDSKAQGPGGYLRRAQAGLTFTSDDQDEKKNDIVGALNDARTDQINRDQQRMAIQSKIAGGLTGPDLDQANQQLAQLSQDDQTARNQTGNLKQQAADQAGQPQWSTDPDIAARQKAAYADFVRMQPAAQVVGDSIGQWQQLQGYLNDPANKPPVDGGSLKANPAAQQPTTTVQDAIDRADKGIGSGVGQAITSVGRLAQDVRSITPAYWAAQLSDHLFGTSLGPDAIKAEQDVVDKGKTVEANAQNFITDPSKDKTLVAKGSEFAGGMLPFTASAAAAPLVAGLTMKEAGREMARDKGASDNAADIASVPIGLLGGAAQALLGPASGKLLANVVGKVAAAGPIAQVISKQVLDPLLKAPGASDTLAKGAYNLILGSAQKGFRTAADLAVQNGAINAISNWAGDPSKQTSTWQAMFDHFNENVLFGSFLHAPEMATTEGNNALVNQAIKTQGAKAQFIAKTANAFGAIDASPQMTPVQKAAAKDRALHFLSPSVRETVVAHVGDVADANRQMGNLLTVGNAAQAALGTPDPTLNHLSDAGLAAEKADVANRLGQKWVLDSKSADPNAIPSSAPDPTMRIGPQATQDYFNRLQAEQSLRQQRQQIQDGVNRHLADIQDYFTASTAATQKLASTPGGVATLAELNRYNATVPSNQRVDARAFLPVADQQSLTDATVNDPQKAATALTSQGTPTSPDEIAKAQQLAGHSQNMPEHQEITEKQQAVRAEIEAHQKGGNKPGEIQARQKVVALEARRKQAILDRLAQNVKSSREVDGFRQASDAAQAHAEAVKGHPKEVAEPAQQAFADAKQKANRASGLAKISNGMHLSKLTAGELAAVGAVPDSAGGFKPAVGVADVAKDPTKELSPVTPSKGGTPIITDEGARNLAKYAPETAKLIYDGETDAKTKADVRADAAAEQGSKKPSQKDAGKDGGKEPAGGSWTARGDQGTEVTISATEARSQREAEPLLAQKLPKGELLDVGSVAAPKVEKPADEAKGAPYDKGNGQSNPKSGADTSGLHPSASQSDSVVRGPDGSDNAQAGDRTDEQTGGAGRPNQGAEGDRAANGVAGEPDVSGAGDGNSVSTKLGKSDGAKPLASGAVDGQISRVKASLDNLNKARGLTGNRAIRVVAQDSQHALITSIDADGNIIIHVSPKAVEHEANAHRFAIHKGDANKWLNHALNEELIHVADMLTARDQWEAQGKPGSAANFWKDERRRDLANVKAVILGGNKVVARAFIDSYRSYESVGKSRPAFATRNISDDDITKVAAELISHIEDTNLGVAHMSEFIRAMIQAKNDGAVTESGYRAVVGRILDWMKRVYDNIQQAAFESPQLQAMLMPIERILAQADSSELGARSPPMSEEEKTAQDKARKDALQEAFGEKKTLLQALRKVGGLPTTDPALQGELDSLKGAKNKGMMMQLFRKDAPALDRVRQRLEEEGFHFDTPAEMVQAITDSVNSGKPLYGLKAGTAAQGENLALGHYQNPGELPLTDKPAEDKKNSTQINMVPAVAKSFTDYAKSIPEADLYKGEDGSDSYGPEYGREDKPHVTVHYGLESDPVAVQKLVKDFGPIELKLGKTSLFKNDKYDVLKVGVEQGDIHRLNSLLAKEYPVESKFPDYKPHLTIAYLKKGEGDKYAGDDRFEGHKIPVDQFVFSDKDRNHIPIDLTSDEDKKPGELVMANRGLAGDIAKRYQVPGVDPSDVKQEANLALMKAARAYDPSNGAKFSTYAYRTISNRLNDLYGKQVKIAGHEDGTLNEPVSETGHTLEETTGDSKANTILPVESAETKGILDDEIRKLPKRPQAIIEGYRAGKNGQEIADELGISRQSVNGSLNGALTILRQRLKARGLEGQEDGILFAGSGLPIGGDGVESGDGRQETNSEPPKATGGVERVLGGERGTSVQGEARTGQGERPSNGQQARAPIPEEIHERVEKALNHASPAERKFIDQSVRTSVSEVEGMTPEELHRLAQSQPKPYPIKGDDVAKLVKGDVHLVTAWDDSMRNDEDAKARKSFFAARGAHEVDSPDLPELDPKHPIVDSTGEASNHFNLSDHEKELVTQPVDTVTNKLSEAQATPGLPQSLGFHQMGIRGPFDRAAMDRIDSQFGRNKWLIKPWDPEEAAQGKNVLFPERLNHILDHGTDEEKQAMQEEIPPHSTMAQERIPIASEKESERANGRVTMPGEKRVHIWTDTNGGVHVIIGGTVDKETGTVHALNTPEVDAAEASAKQAVEGLPLAERRGSLFGPDVVRAADGTYRAVETNPNIIDGQTDKLTGRKFDQSMMSGYLDYPAVQDAVLSALRGDLPRHVELARKAIEPVNETRANARPSEDLFGHEPEQGTLFAGQSEREKYLKDLLGQIQADMPSQAEIGKMRQTALGEPVGKQTIGNPDKANYAPDRETRRGIDAIQDLADSRREAETQQQWVDQARERVQRDPDAVKTELLQKAFNPEAYGTFSPVDVKAAQLLVPRLMRDAYASGDRAKIKEASTLAWAYDAGGSDQARAFAARRDPFKTPAERHLEFLTKMISTPSAKDRAWINNAPDAEEKRNRLEQAQSERLQRITKALGDMGVRLEDVFAGEAAVHLKSTKFVQDAVTAMGDPQKQKAGRMILDKYSAGQIAKELKISPNDAKQLQQTFRANLAPAFEKYLDRGFSESEIMEDLKNSDLSKLFAGDDDGVRKGNLTPEQKSAALKRLLDAVTGDLDDVNSGKMQRRLKRRVDKPLPYNGRGPSDAPIPAYEPMKQDVMRPNMTPEELAEYNRTRRPSDAPSDAARYRQQQLEYDKELPYENVPFDPANKDQVFKLARAIQASEGNKFDMVYEAWVNSILSGPQTHVALSMGMAANAAWDFSVQRGAEALTNAAFFHDPNAAQFGEFKPMLKAVFPAIARGLKFAAKVFNSEEHYAFERSVLNQQMEFKGAGDVTGGHLPAIPGKIGRVVRLPARVVMFQDSFFKQVIGQMEASAQAYRLGKAQGLAGDELDKYIHGQVNLPGSDAWQRAVSKAEEGTFQTALRSHAEGGGPAEGIARKVQDLRNGNASTWQGQLGEKMLGFIFPFIRTPYNIFRTGLSKTPLGSVAVAGRIADGLFSVKNGKPFIDGYSKAQMVKDLATQSIAWASAAMLYGMVEGDKDDDTKQFLITGSRPHGVDKEGSRDLANRTAGGPYQIRIGGRNGTYINYGRIEPFATVLGTVADAMRIAKQKQDLATSLVKFGGYFMAQAQDKTFLQGISSVAEAVQTATQDPQNVAKGIGRQFLQGLVPNLIRQPLRNLDDYERDTRNAGPGYEMTSLGGLAPKKYDLYGNAEVKQGSPLSRIVARSGDVPTAALQRGDAFLENWNRMNPQQTYYPAREGNYTYKDATGKKVAMTPAQIAQFDQKAGKTFAAGMSGWLTPQMANAPTEEDVKMFREELEKARKSTKDEMFGGGMARQPARAGTDISTLMGWK